MRKVLLLTLTILILSSFISAQTPPQQSVFNGTTVTFNLSPINLPGTKQGTLTGVETDTLFPLTTNNIVGMTALIGESTFIGGRYNHVFPSVAKYLENHTALTGANFQFGLTSSLGVVKSPIKPTWGGRAGFFLNYAPAGSQNFSLGFEAQANYLPYYNGPLSQHWVPSVAVGPNFRF